MCMMHYTRLSLYGSTNEPHRVKVWTRFLSHVNKTDSCWLWTGNISNYGYGRFGVEHDLWLAHRYAWTKLVGPIPEGKDIDHICHVKALRKSGTSATGH